MGRGSVTTQQAGEQMSMHVRYNTERRYRMEVLPEAHGRSSKQREPPRKPAQRKLWSCGDRERSVRIRSDSTSSSLHAIPLFPPRLPPFIGQEGSRSGINFLPTELPMYLTPYYIQRRSRTREGPVCTRSCTNCAWGLFSSRQRIMVISSTR